AGTGRRLEPVLTGDDAYPVRADELLEAALRTMCRVALHVAAGDRDPAGFAGRPAVPAMQLAADHDAEADAAADPAQYEVLNALCGPGVRLGDRHEVHVVLEAHQALQVVAQLREQTALPARQVKRERKVAGARVDEAGRTEHDAAYIVERRVRLLRG